VWPACCAGAVGFSNECGCRSKCGRRSLTVASAVSRKRDASMSCGKAYEGGPACHAGAESFYNECGCRSRWEDAMSLEGHGASAVSHEYRAGTRVGKAHECDRPAKAGAAGFYDFFRLNFFCGFGRSCPCSRRQRCPAGPPGEDLARAPRHTHHLVGYGAASMPRCSVILTLTVLVLPTVT